MPEKRIKEIAYQLLKLSLRQDFSFQGLASLDRKIGNYLKEPEIMSAQISEEELREFGKLIFTEITKELTDKLFVGVAGVAV